MWFLISLVAFRMTDVACTPTDSIRLVDGSNLDEGRLEIYHNGIWGTVCDDHFDCAAAMVVCRQLGYRIGFSLGNFVKDGNGPIWLDDVHCEGTESSITICPHRPWKDHNCQHHEDVGVYCFRSYDNSYESHFYRKYCNGTVLNKTICDSDACCTDILDIFVQEN
ncbi:macrophage scavenger receptor types I and II-like isoform X2 [Mytilus edulis]|uniref:macrophage scavenger receptor types I and II-like isoform X2 n=1 Tax=Mytilus edulis TaxID=6550 RepID=UPI0039EE6BF6